jgi:carbamoylphosphate synthase large subunit
VELNSKRQFPGLDNSQATEAINNKEKFRVFALRHGLPVPRVVSHEQTGDIWPLIVKPVDAYSGRGITIIRESDRSALPEALRRAKEYSRTKACIIEEYVEGQLYSHSAFLSEGTIEAEFIVEEHGSANPFVVDTSRVVQDFSPDTLQHIREDVLRMAKILGLVDGLIHTQFILNGNSYWMIEVTRRCPGDLYSELIERSTGFRYAETYVNYFLGKKDTRASNSSERSFVLRHTISQPAEKTFGSIQFNTQLHIQNFIPLSLAGDYVKGSPFGRIGLLFVKAGSAEDLTTLLQMAIERKLYVLH